MPTTNTTPLEELKTALKHFEQHELASGFKAMRAAIAGLESSPPSANDIVTHLQGPRGPLHALLDEMVKEGVAKALAERAPAPSAALEREAACWSVMTEAMVDKFLEDYEMRGEDEQGRDACHAPSEGERVLIKDAIMGLFAEADDRARASLHSVGTDTHVALTRELVREIRKGCQQVRSTTDGRKHAEAHALADWVMAKLSRAATVGAQVAEPAALDGQN